VIHLYGVPLSTNVERVSLALAYKGLNVESIVVDYDDRSEVRRVSGQDRVPVIVDDGVVVADSTTILRWLESRYPEPPLFPTEPARRAETEVFVEWFEGVWKRRIFRGLAMELIYSDGEPDEDKLSSLRSDMRTAHDLLEGLLSGRDYLLDDFSAADCVAFPFIKFAAIWPEGDEYELHELLRDEQQFGDAHPNLAAWIARVDERPRV
jgi:glutathione S-transferase